MFKIRPYIIPDKLVIFTFVFQLPSYYLLLSPPPLPLLLLMIILTIIVTIITHQSLTHYPMICSFRNVSYMFYNATDMIYNFNRRYYAFWSTYYQYAVDIDHDNATRLFYLLEENEGYIKQYFLS